jgi:hypothetical protein
MVVKQKLPFKVVGRQQSLHHHPLYNARIPLDNINVLSQPRKTFNDIMVLGDSIADQNQLELLLVARYDAKHCREYIRIVNDLWEGKKYRIEDLKYAIENGEKIYYILIDGERRYRSCIYLRNVGCEECRKKFGEGSCYERHFGDLLVEARISINLDPDIAIDTQGSANTHHRVPPYEEAKYFNNLYGRRRKKNPEYTLKEFAGKMGRPLEAIRQALKFCELPMEYQDHVKNKTLAWGIAIEIIRLKEAGTNSEELDWWVTRVIVENLKVSAFRETVSKYLRDRDSGQTSLFGMFEEEYEREMRRAFIKMVVGRDVINGIWFFQRYLGRLIDLGEKGKLGKKDSPFSSKSPVRVLRDAVDKLEKALPYLEDQYPEKAYMKAVSVVEKAKPILSQLEENLPE